MNHRAILYIMPFLLATLCMGCGGHGHMRQLERLEAQLDTWIENKLNNRPRKKLGYLTPNEKFNLLLTN